jgi:hypothetical protein
MGWTDDYVAIMRDQGREPFDCVVAGCSHISGGTFRMMLHHLFGTHETTGGTTNG